MKRYTVEWMMPPQVGGASRARCEEYRTLGEAVRAMDVIRADSQTWQSGGLIRLYRDGRRIRRTGRAL